MTRREQIRVLLVDDQPVICEGVRRELERAPHLALVGTAADLEHARRQLTATAPHVAVIDIDLGKNGVGDGLRFVREIGRLRPDTYPLIFSTYDDADLVVEAANAGARGYVLKQYPLPDLATAIERVADGGTYYSPGLAPGPAGKDQPTPREREVLELVARGRSSPQIAEDLGIASRTAESHRASVMGKLGAKNTAELVSIAHERGLLSRRRTNHDAESDDAEPDR